jgi:hypothetical protein
MNIYQKAAEHLYNMSEPASINGTCFYRVDFEVEDGNRCAVGAIISNEFYNNTLEYKQAGDPRVIKAVALSNGIDEDDIRVDTLSEIQRLHDGWGAGEISKKEVNKNLVDMGLIEGVI